MYFKCKCGRDFNNGEHTGMLSLAEMIDDPSMQFLLLDCSISAFQCLTDVILAQC